MKMVMKKLVYTSVFVVMSFGSFSVNSADTETGKNKAALCAGCHGVNGISMSPEIPNLAGQKSVYLAKAIRDYKSGARKNPMMTSVVGMIVDEDIDDIAAYFSSLK